MRIVVVVLAAALAAPVPASALSVSSAKITKGAIVVKGRDAAPSAFLSWEGGPAGQARSSGGFTIATTLLPADCVGALSDGVGTVQVVIPDCAPRGEPGERGEPGPIGSPGPVGQPGPVGTPGAPGANAPRFVVKDADGRTLGTYAGFDGHQLIAVHRVGQADIGVPFDSAGPQCSDHFCESYESNDCTGAAFSISGVGVFTPGSVRGGILYYYAGPGMPVIPRSIRCCDGACNPQNPSGFEYQGTALATEDLSAFVPPFRVVLE